MSITEKLTMTEDFPCDYCGYPLFKGETALFYEGDITGVFCSVTCAANEERAAQDRIKARLAAYARADNPTVYQRLQEVTQ